LGCNFDCASQAEIEAVINLPGVNPNDIIFANPCKQKSHLEYAKRMDVKRVTFDCVSELEKIKLHHPDAEVVLRLRVDDTGAVCRLGTKFGALPHECDELFERCKELELKIIGISFHVGSGQKRARSFVDALRVVYDIYESAREEHGLDFKFLDIGGGFPGWDEKNLKFEKIANSISQCVADLFPNCHVIAEPGRYFCGACGTLLTKVSTKKCYIDETGEKFFKYFVNDGVYASFNNVLYDHATPIPNYISWKYKSGVPMYMSTVYGPTCDSLDRILDNHPMPELPVDSFMFWENMGAYTSCASSAFNGCPMAKIVYLYRGE